MATPAATYCNVGTGTGQNRYKLDYCLGDGLGISTLTTAQYAAQVAPLNATAGTPILSDSPDGMMLLRADVDFDPIAENGYPRTESREMALDGTTNRAFDAEAGDHWIKVIFKVLHLPPEKPSMVVVQLHDDVQDIMEFAVQPVTGYNKTTNPKVELVCRINGTSSGVPKLVADFKYNTVYVAKIRVGAIGAGSAIAWEAYIDNMVTPKVKSSDAGMALLDTAGTVSYFKWGCYLQTKSTGNGTGGLETDVNEYGEVGYRDVQTSHNGETAPGTLAFGTQALDTVANVRWGTKSTAHRTVNPSAISATPGLPATLVNGDMMLCIARSSRGITSTSTAATVSAPAPNTAPSTPATPSGWTRIISTKSTHDNVGPPLLGAYPGGPELEAHTIRWVLFAKKWVNGDLPPSVDIASGTTLTDTVTAQVVAFSGSRYTTDLLNLLDQPPNGLDLTNPNDNNLTVTGINYAAAVSSTVVGPTAALPANATPGSLAIACVYHETNLTSGGVGIVTGGADALTWAEGGEGVTITVTPAAGTASASADEPAFGHDWAIVPASGSSVAIGAKQAAATLSTDANKPNNAVSTAGTGWGVLFTIAAAKNHGRRRVG